MQTEGMTPSRVTTGLLLTAALGTLIATSVSVTHESCEVGTRTIWWWGATPFEAILLSLSIAAAATAGASVAARRGGRLYVLMWTLVVGGLWFVLVWTVFFVTDLSHCPIGPIEF
jgi:hypothetical protein